MKNIPVVIVDFVRTASVVFVGIVDIAVVLLAVVVAVVVDAIAWQWTVVEVDLKVGFGRMQKEGAAD